MHVDSPQSAYPTGMPQDYSNYQKKPSLKKYLILIFEELQQFFSRINHFIRELKALFIPSKAKSQAPVIDPHQPQNPIQVVSNNLRDYVNLGPNKEQITIPIQENAKVENVRIIIPQTLEIDPSSITVPLIPEMPRDSNKEILIQEDVPIINPLVPKTNSPIIHEDTPVIPLLKLKTVDVDDSVKPKAELDFTHYHHPIFRAHPAFSGSEYDKEYRDVANEKSDVSKKNIFGADILLLNLRNLFKKVKSENSDEIKNSEIEILLESFYSINLDFKEIHGRTEQWIEDQKTKVAPSQLQGRGTRGGPAQRGGRGGPIPSIGRNAKEETINEKAKIFIAWQKAKNKYNDKLEELKQPLIPENKYSKHLFDYEDFRIISENIAKDLDIIDGFRPVSTPRKTKSITTTEILTKEEIERIRQQIKIFEDWNLQQKLLNRVKLDKKNCDAAVNQSIKSLNSIPISEMLKIDRRNDVENLDELLLKQKEYNEQVEELEKRSKLIIEGAPEGLFSPNTCKILSGVKLNSSDANKAFQNRMKQQNPPPQKSNGTDHF